MRIDRIMPFLWLKQESKEELEQELWAMLEMGITSFVVESRVHHDFCGDAWFEEMDFILAFAKEHDMKVWLLDDKSYPTGYANGIFFNSGDNYKSRRVRALRTDVCGCKKDIKVQIPLNPEYDERLLGVYLAKRGENYSQLYEPIDITDCVHDGFVYFDINGGQYSVISVIETSRYYERQGYVDMLNPMSVGKLIEAVYEPHYERYQQYFGNTFCGFFSDEPRFNCFMCRSGVVDSAYEGKIGIYGMAYPWNSTVEEYMGRDASILSLWFDIGQKTAEIRCKYMEYVTDCYAANFVSQLSEWCHQRGVLYTGHIIEDMDAHTSLMCSAGHYFKAMKGADLASVDVVLNQIIPLENQGWHMADLDPGYSDSLFFNYTLMKLASSDAHLDKHKGGRALCEIFGAYGWGESIPEMIYLANHALVRGINHFIPHAFTSEFDNPDCPPHFYAGGKNPANRGYRLLFDYMNEVSGLLSDGKTVIDVAVLYHAQAEWSGGDYDVCDMTAKVLMDNQIDFDFVDFEALAHANITGDLLEVNGNQYKALIVPYYEKLPLNYEQILKKIESKIVYTEKGSKNLASIIKEFLGYTYTSKDNLRVMRYEKENESYMMLFNEGEETICVRPQNLWIDFKDGKYANDYIAGTYLPIGKEEIQIKPLQALICQKEPRGIQEDMSKLVSIEPSSQIYLKGYDEEEYRYYKHVEKSFFSINTYYEVPDFSGFMRIEPEIDWKKVSHIRVEYEAEFCELHYGGNVYRSIGGVMSLDLDKKFASENNCFFVLSCGLGNVLKDDFSHCNYVSPCKLNAIYVLYCE